MYSSGSRERSRARMSCRRRALTQSVSSIALALVLAAAGVTAAEPSSAAPTASLTSGPSSGPASAGAAVDPSLEADTADGTRVPVIVQLAGVPTVAGDDSGRPPARRAQIRRSIDDVLNGLPPGSFENSRPIGDLAMMSMVVDGQALSSLAANPGVTRVSQNKANHPLGTNTTNIGAPAAWVQGFQGSGQTVAVVDTGVATSHSYLAGKVVAEGCFSSDLPATTAGFSAANCPGPDPGAATGAGTGQPCPADVDGCEHGTHVAGIAVGGAAGSFSGVAPSADLISVNVFSSYNASAPSHSSCGGVLVPKCAVAWDSDIIRGLLYVDSLRSTMSIAAVNLSLGGGSPTSKACDSDPLAPAINQLKNHGIAVVVAAGNDSSKTGLSSPACVSASISVGATNPTTDAVASWSDSSPLLSLLAPGVGINSSQPATALGTSVCPAPYAPDRCASFSGTSMATPHVAGAIAVLRQARPLLGGSTVSAAQVDAQLVVLRSTGKNVTDSANGIVTPRLQLDAAVSSGLDAPGAPTGVVAVAGVQSASVSWAAPVSDGGTAITSYTVTSNAGGNACTWASGPLVCVVSGLTSGTSYTFTVTATNVVGTGPPSDASNAVVPTPVPSSFFHGVAPVRVLDSRPATNVGAYVTPWAGGSSRDVAVGGLAGVPLDATAVVLNVTVTNTSSPSYLTIWPAGQDRPTVSSLNWSPGVTIANAVTVKMGAGLSAGKIAVFNGYGSVDVVIDIAGYYQAGSGKAFHPINPGRVLDSRPATQVNVYGTPWTGGLSRDVAVGGLGGVPVDATAVVLNVTVTNTSSPSYLTIWPAGQDRPTTSNLNWATGVTIPNAVIVTLGTAGKIAVFNWYGKVDVVTDAAGWFG